MWAKLKPYVISIAIALGVGGLSAFLTRNNMNIYERIMRPALAPPAIVFPIVWTICKRSIACTLTNISR